MASYNKVLLLGNLTRDPEVRVTPKGTQICQLGLAVNRQFKDESGAAREETTFVDIEAWGKQAEVISKYCVKGSPLFVEGRLRLDTWDDKQTGQKRNKMKVVLEGFQLLGGRPSSGGSATGAPEDMDQSYEPRSVPPPRQPSPRNAPPPASSSMDEDVPF